MIEEYSRKARAAQQFRALALALAQRTEPQEAAKASPLAPILDKLGLRAYVRRAPTGGSLRASGSDPAGLTPWRALPHEACACRVLHAIPPRRICANPRARSRTP